VKVIQITYPPGITKVAELADNIPFKAKVVIKSLKGKSFPKDAISSMFPKNWSKVRIQEEVAYVYENTVARGVNQIPKQANDVFNKFRGQTTEGFEIIIEVDDFGKIINSYPKI
jgi:Bacterial EndoU nuclease